MSATEQKTEHRAEQQRQRAAYLEGALTHDAYYLWLSDWLGLSDALIPFSAERVAASTDPHLNDLPLRQWDTMHPFVVQSARKAVPLSLSDTVCCLKAMARRRAGKVLPPK